MLATTDIYTATATAAAAADDHHHYRTAAVSTINATSTSVTTAAVAVSEFYTTVLPRQKLQNVSHFLCVIANYRIKQITFPLQIYMLVATATFI